MRAYEIIATLGPASQEERVWEAMLSAGASGFRLNTSHLSLAELEGWLERLAEFFARLHIPKESPKTRGRYPGALLTLDLQGSKWRLGEFPPFQLVAGQVVELVYASNGAGSGRLPVPHPDFFLAAGLSNGRIALDDAKILLELESFRMDWMSARVRRGGEIHPRKGITFEACEYRKESLHEKDWAILEMTRGLGFVQYAISYVKDAAEMAHYRELAGGSAPLVAKIERRTALDEPAQVAAQADGLWLCRGDLGAELGLREMAFAVHRFSERVRRLPVPALLAGQVLEHMTSHAAPTRSEVCMLYEALGWGYAGFVLSDETALGQDPVECCRAAAMFRGSP